MSDWTSKLRRTLTADFCVFDEMLELIEAAWRMNPPGCPRGCEKCERAYDRVEAALKAIRDKVEKAT